MTVTNAPDSAYELCSKYAPDCGGASSHTFNNQGGSSSRAFSDSSSRGRSDSYSSRSSYEPSAGGRGQSDSSSGRSQQESSASGRGQYESSASGRGQYESSASDRSQLDSSASDRTRSKDSRKKSSSKNKTKSSVKKSKKAISPSQINTRNIQTLRTDNEGYITRDNSDDLENLGFNGEDDYYDSLNSGNEDGIFGETSRPDIDTVTDISPQEGPSYVGFDEDSRNPIIEEEVVSFENERLKLCLTMSFISIATK